MAVCKTCNQEIKKDLYDSRYKCPMEGCGGYMITLRTMEKRVCVHCYTEVDWKLKEGQLPLIQHQR